jgi:hypothetical protein
LHFNDLHKNALYLYGKYKKEKRFDPNDLFACPKYFINL